MPRRNKRPSSERQYGKDKARERRALAKKRKLHGLAGRRLKKTTRWVEPPLPEF